ncbi:hypothetical protein OG422_21075 [Streptomyces sp. NBC_01525]|uniref:Uncharacterized protein n=1 Tax=Streptomyces benahoarensis TaxID=2595054 RepID=A0A553YPP8_9ACTN|nr:hypothetical protein [Streptomyces benahoarensis]TSB18411.1 hypothetical protein FNJ62_24280 [Streptomyces benahoarensis]TSB31190.1 hypothetical protein FNZ23_26010 [Streptomyces benahoarensis]
MISFIEMNKMTDRSVVATCSLGSSLLGTGMSDFGRLSGVEVKRPEALLSLVAEERSARPAQAPAVAAVAAVANAFVSAAANGAGSQQQYRQHETWAYRGLEPWRDPA